MDTSSAHGSPRFGSSSAEAWRRAACLESELYNGALAAHFSRVHAWQRWIKLLHDATSQAKR